MPSGAAIDTTTTIVWLISKLQDDMEVEKLYEFLDDVVSSFQQFVSELDCQN
jgi:DNA/RNA-binding domain of Phe-tRNA-synthetase-like protein